MQLHGWLREQGVRLPTLLKKEVQRKLAEMEADSQTNVQTDAQVNDAVREMLRLRLEMSRSSSKKYEAMARCVCKDGRIHGMFRFYGASRTGRFASQIVNLQNLRRNDMEDLALARSLLREGRAEDLSLLYASAPDVLSAAEEESLAFLSSFLSHPDAIAATAAAARRAMNNFLTMRENFLSIKSLYLYHTYFCAVCQAFPQK